MGGLVGSIGALGAVVLVPMFAFMTTVTGMEQATFLVLFLVVLAAFLWMHITIVMMLHKASPHLSGKFEHDHSENDAEPANDSDDKDSSDVKSETKQESPIGA